MKPRGLADLVTANRLRHERAARKVSLSLVALQSATARLSLRLDAHERAQATRKRGV